MDTKVIKLILVCFLGFGAFIGLVLFVIGFLFQFSNKNYIETTGVISNIEEEHNGSATGHNTFVTYTVDGITYTGVLDVSSSTDSIGKEVKVFYEPSDPQRIHGDMKPFVIGFMAIGGMVFLLEAVSAVVVLLFFGRTKKAAQ